MEQLRNNFTTLVNLELNGNTFIYGEFLKLHEKECCIFIEAVKLKLGNCGMGNCEITNFRTEEINTNGNKMFFIINYKLKTENGNTN